MIDTINWWFLTWYMYIYIELYRYIYIYRFNTSSQSSVLSSWRSWTWSCTEIDSAGFPWCLPRCLDSDWLWTLRIVAEIQVDEQPGTQGLVDWAYIERMKKTRGSSCWSRSKVGDPTLKPRSQHKNGRTWQKAMFLCFGCGGKRAYFQRVYL